MSPRTRVCRWGSLAFLLVSALPAVAQPLPPSAPSPFLPPPPTAPAPAHPPPPEASHCCEEERPGAFFVSADYLLLQARSRPLDFAIVGASNPFGPQGDVRSLTWDVQSGFRVGAGYRLPGEGWEVGGYYTYFHTNAHDSAAAGPGNTLFPTLTHPGMVEEATSAVANGTLNYNLADVEISKHFQPSESLHVRTFAGPRFADIDHEINVVYDGGDAHTDHVRSRLDFDGGGFRVGAEGQWSIWQGLGLYARGGGSLLTGSFRSTLTETTNSGATTIVNVTDRFHKVVPVLELGMGVNWKYCNWTVSAGYELVNWFGVVDGPDFVDDSHQGKMTRRTSDLGLEGLVVRAVWEF